MQPLSNFSNLTDSHICLKRLFSNAHKFYHVIMSPFGREKHFVQQPILATLIFCHIMSNMSNNGGLPQGDWVDSLRKRPQINGYFLVQIAIVLDIFMYDESILNNLRG